MTEGNETLVVRHLPAELSTSEQEDLLRHFGASHVRCMGNKGRLKYVAFATFPSKEDAEYALARLHQLEILGSCLVAEYSKKQYKKYHPSQTSVKPPELDKEEKEKAASTRVTEQEQRKRITEIIDSMSSKWGVEYQINPRLQYMYPAPTVNILTNIANALASVPKFYVQVLHLMNKMNLPAPFGPVTPTPPLPNGQPTMEEQQVPTENQDVDVASTEESEIESEEEKGPSKAEVNVPRKRPHRGSKPKAKRPRFQQILAAPVLPKEKRTVAPDPTEVFEQPQVAGPKKIEFNLTDAIASAFSSERLPSIPQPYGVPPVDIVSLVEQQQAVEPVEEGGFGKIEPVQKEQDKSPEADEEEEWGASEFISRRELRKGRISSSQMKDFSVFRNYEAGEPTSRLYIKNVAKTVTEKDLHYIYGRYVNWDKEEEKLMFDIRLMKEGRMKGQAFVTLPDEKKALDAVKDTNGFVLQSKPLVVQFARSAKPKDTDQKSSKKSKN